MTSLLQQGGPAPTEEELRYWEVACEAATPGPWFSDSYSRIMSVPATRKAHEWYKASGLEDRDPDDVTDDEWRRFAAEEPVTTVLRMPVQAGDTATRQGAMDGDFVIAAREAMPRLITALRAEREKYDSLRDAVESLVPTDYGYAQVSRAEVKRIEIAQEILTKAAMPRTRGPVSFGLSEPTLSGENEEFVAKLHKEEGP